MAGAQACWSMCDPDSCLCISGQAEQDEIWCTFPAGEELDMTDSRAAARPTLALRGAGSNFGLTVCQGNRPPPLLPGRQQCLTVCSPSAASSDHEWQGMAGSSHVVWRCQTASEPCWFSEIFVGLASGCTQGGAHDAPGGHFSMSTWDVIATHPLDALQRCRTGSTLRRTSGSAGRAADCGGGGWKQSTGLR